MGKSRTNETTRNKSPPRSGLEQTANNNILITIFIRIIKKTDYEIFKFKLYYERQSYEEYT